MDAPETGLTLLLEAEKDILDIHDWYESRRLGLGAEFELCIDEAFERINRHPEASPIWYRSTRRLILSRFPYSLHFAVLTNDIIVIAIMHVKRCPVRIQSRLNSRLKNH